MVVVNIYSEKDTITDAENGANILNGVKNFKVVIYGRKKMEWNDYNWSMKEKGEEIFVFFELFCVTIILMTAGISKVIDWIEK